MVKKNRLDWSRKRVITLIAASGVTMLLLGLASDQLLHSRTLHPALWLVAFANMVQWCAYLATTLRDEMRQETADIVRDTIRVEVAKLLDPIDSKIEEIDADVHEYGDRREANGTVLGMRLASQRGSNATRHLNPVE